MSRAATAAPARYLTQVQLNNIRAFRELVLSIEGEEEAPRKRTLVIGRNGTCKSTLLRAIAIGLADPGDAQALIASPAIDQDGVVRGILLVDEIDQHLHPSMQAQVLPRLSELLPEVQIIATTHSPLVALGAAPEEMVALHRLASGEVGVAPAPDFRLYSAEDMLTDDRLFDTPPYSEEVNEKTERYRELVEIPARSRRAREERELHVLARELTRPADPSEPDVAAFEEVKSILAKHGIE